MLSNFDFEFFLMIHLGLMIFGNQAIWVAFVFPLFIISALFGWSEKCRKVMGTKF